MAVLFDTSILLLLLQPNAAPPIDPSTSLPLTYARDRVDFLIKGLVKKKIKVIIPTPALAELLVRAGTAENEWLRILQQAPFKIVPFDTRAAVECAESFRSYGVRGKGKENTRTKIKFDYQIMAIAQVEEVEVVYSDDEDIHKYAKHGSFEVVRSLDLKLDPDDKQGILELS